MPLLHAPLPVRSSLHLLVASCPFPLLLHPLPCAQVGTLLYIQASDAFLSANDNPYWGEGQAKDRMRATVAGGCRVLDRVHAHARSKVFMPVLCMICHNHPLLFCLFLMLLLCFLHCAGFIMTAAMNAIMVLLLGWECSC